MKKISQIILLAGALTMPTLLLAVDEKSKADAGISVTRDAVEIKVKGNRKLVEYAARTLIGTSCESIEKIYFKIGNQAFAAPSKTIVNEYTLAQYTSFTVFKNTDEMEVVIPRTLGCEGNPARYVYAQLKTSKSNFPSMTISDDSGAVNILKYLNHMGSSGMCKTTKHADVIACIGSKTVEGEKVQVIFLIPLGQDGKGIASGTSELPIHVRCEGVTEKNLGCAVSEYFANQFKVTMEISKDDLTKENIISLREQMLQSTKSVMMK
jgi:hypothetical protein